MAKNDTDTGKEQEEDGAAAEPKTTFRKRTRRGTSAKGVGDDNSAADKGRGKQQHQLPEEPSAPPVTVHADAKPWKFTAYFKLWGGADGTLQVSFGVHSDDATEHLILLQERIQSLQNMGYNAQAGGTKPGENVQEVDGWVKGEGSKGEPRLYLYKSPLKWKVATIYIEDFAKVPIAPDEIAKAQSWPAAAPEREQAVARGILSLCNFSVVLVDSGRKSDSGNTIKRFDRALGFGSKDATNEGVTTKNRAKADSLQEETQFMGSQEDVQSFADTIRLLQGNDRKFADWCRKKQTSGMPANKDGVDILAEEIDNIVEEKGVGYNFLEIVSGLSAEDIYNISDTLADSLVLMIAPFVIDGKGGLQENLMKQQKYIDAVKSIWKTVGQFMDQ